MDLPEENYAGKAYLATTVKWVVLVTILLIALLLRRYTFNLPHLRGDQAHYVALAMKLKTQGISGYNLRGVDMKVARDYPDLSILVPAEGKGDILESLKMVNIHYYDEPLHHIPFAFPLALLASHEILARGEEFSVLHVTDEGEVVKRAPPGIGLRDYRFDPLIAGRQFYSVIIPFSFSIFFIILVYLLGKVLYESEWVALTAMFLMAISPVDIMSSQRIWADDMTAAFAALALLLYVLSVKRGAPFLAFAGGLSCGLSAITKQTGAFILFVVVLWHVMINLDRLFKKETFFYVLFDKKVVLFIAGAVLSSVYWFYKIASVYGSPFYRPPHTTPLNLIAVDWFRRSGARPTTVYLVGPPYQNPLFSLAYVSPLWLLFDRRRIKETLFLIIWGAVFLFIFLIYLGAGEAKELRLLLPCYPAFALLGAYVANRMRLYINERMGFCAGTILLLAVLVASALWSIPMGLEALFYNRFLIMKPF